MSLFFFHWPIGLVENIVGCHCPLKHYIPYYQVLCQLQVIFLVQTTSRFCYTDSQMIDLKHKPELAQFNTGKAW